MQSDVCYFFFILSELNEHSYSSPRILYLHSLWLIVVCKILFVTIVYTAYHIVLSIIYGTGLRTALRSDSVTLIKVMLAPCNISEKPGKHSACSIEICIS